MTTKISVNKLSGVPSTLMYPVYARANESKMPNPIVKDPYSLELLEKLDFDFSIFENIPEKAGFSKKDMQTGIAVRTELIDKAVQLFLEEHPRGLVVNLGCGFDARFFRLDNQLMKWIDVDLEDVIKIKRKLFEESDRYKFLSASILEPDWLNDIQSMNSQQALIIAEGTLMYFTEKEVRNLVERLIEKFPKAIFVFEVMGSALAGKVHPSVQCLKEEIICPWGIHDYKALESWHPKLKLKQSDIFIDQHRKRWTLPARIITRLFSRQKPKFGHAILKMEIG